MHDEIRRFNLTGEVTPDKFLSARDALIKDVEDSMRDEGFVPVLDLLPQFTREYNPESATFAFELSVYGVYVGDQECQVAGMMNGRAVEKSTRLAK